MPLDITHLVAFVVGAFSGAAGHYLGAKYTDIRKRKEQNRAAVELIKRMYELMPKLISEMKEDIILNGYETVREFVVLPNKRVNFNGGGKKRFAYFENTIDDLRGKIEILEGHGLVIDVTTGNTPIYRMTEGFIDLLSRLEK